ncbi:MAG: hypothetical protein JSS99_02115 [Actinobacteria bacterium]|nr:hypothetical protein [Actinomycetota bacterium]
MSPPGVPPRRAGQCFTTGDGMLQPLQGRFGNDGLQYHFFCDDDRVFGVRVVKTALTEVHWAWVSDRDGTRTIHRREAFSEQAEGASLSMHSPGFHIVTDETGGGSLDVDGPGGLHVDFEVKTRKDADRQLEGQTTETFYHPDLDCTVTYDGKTSPAIGFMKRYMYPEPPRHWHWLFLQGYASDRSYSLWTADACFAFLKYNYFRILPRDGKLFEADVTRTHHARGLVRADTPDGGEYEARFEPIAEPADCLIKTAEIETLVRQTPVRFTLSDGAETSEGIAIYEYGAGTA